MKIQKTRELLEEAKQLFKKRDYIQSQKLFSQVIEAEPSSTDGYFYLANIFHLRGELGKAIQSFQKVLELDPSYTDAAISLSILYNDIGRYEDAKKVFDRTHEKVTLSNKTDGVHDQQINRKFSAKHHEVADLYMTYQRFDEALVEYKKAYNLDPHNLDIRLKISKLYAKRGYVSKAYEELRKLKNEYPAFHQASLALGILHFSQGKVIEAQSEWNRVLAKDPTNQDAKMYLDMSHSATETVVTL